MRAANVIPAAAGPLDSSAFMNRNDLFASLSFCPSVRPSVCLCNALSLTTWNFVAVALVRAKRHSDAAMRLVVCESAPGVACVGSGF